jgi:hypothetical protein
MSTFFDPLEPAELAAIRAKGNHVVRRCFVPVEPATVITATVAETPPYPDTGQPIGELSISGVSGTLGDVRLGMDVWIGTSAGACDVATLRVRKTPTGSTLYIMEQGSGDPGIATLLTHTRIAAGHHVTVVATYSVSYAFPRIVVATDDIYKDFDETYSDQTIEPPPVANLGAFAVGFVDDAGYFEFTRSSQNSYAVAPGASIAGQTWSAPGGSFVDCSATDETVTLKYPAGRYWLECTVQDGNGKAATGRIYVAALARAGEHAPLRVLRVLGDTANRDGRRLTLHLDPAEAGLGTLPHGALAVYFEEMAVEGQDVSSFTRNLAVGWVIREQASFSPNLPDGTFELAGPGVLLDQVPAVPQRLEAKATPTEWHQAVPELVNVPGAIWYLLRFHCPPLLDIFDLYLFPGESWSDTAQAGFKFSGASVGSQIESIRRLIPALFGSFSDGALVLARDPNHLVDRGGLVPRVVFGPADWRSVDGDRQNRPSIGLVYGTGLGFAGGVISPFRAVAPDLVPGQGPGQDTIEGMVSNSIMALRWQVGMEYAARNNPMPGVSVALVGNRDVAEPAAGVFVAIEVPAADLDPATTAGAAWLRFFGLTSQPVGAQTLRILPERVSVQHAAGYKTVTLSGPAETYGSPGVELPIEMPSEPYEALPSVRGVIVPRPRPLATFVPKEVSPEIPMTDANIVYVGNYRCRNFVTGSSPSWASCGDPGTLWPGDSLNVAFRVVAEDTGSGYQWTVQRSDTLNSMIYWTTVQALNVGFITDADAVLWFDYADKFRCGLIYDYKPLYGSGYYDSYNWTEEGGYWPSTEIFKPNCDLIGGVGGACDHWSQGILFAAVHVDGCDVGIYKASGNYGRDAGNWSLVTTLSDSNVAPRLWMAHRKPDGTPNDDGSHQYMVYNARFYRTRNGWSGKTDVTPGLGGYSWPVIQLWIDWYDPDKLFARLRRLVSYPTYESGAAISNDGGETWNWVLGPSSDNEVLAVGGFPYSTQCLVASREDGIYYSSNRGQNWANRTGNYPVPGGSKVQVVFDE